MSVGAVLISVGAALHIATQTAWSLPIVILDAFGGLIFLVGYCYAMIKFHDMQKDVNNDANPSSAENPRGKSKLQVFWKNLTTWRLQGYFAYQTLIRD
jgi:hypothetical protein